MEIGLALPHYDHSVPGRPVRWETAAAWAAAAERAGLASVWVSDHLFVDPARWGLPPGRSTSLEALTTLAALARVTSRVRLGTLVLCASLRPPAVLAKALATIDVLSGGRVVAGLGAGWQEAEYAEAGLAFPPPGERLAHLAETVEVLRLAFAGEPFDHLGRHLRISGMVVRPRPAQRPGLPLWVGGRGPRLVALAARRADGWNSGGWVVTTEEEVARTDELRRACEAAGRDPAAVTRSVNRLALVGEDEADLRRRWERLVSSPHGVAVGDMSLDEFRRGRLVGTVDDVGEQLARLGAAGVAHVIVTPGAVPFSLTGADDIDLMASASRR